LKSSSGFENPVSKNALPGLVLSVYPRLVKILKFSVLKFKSTNAPEFFGSPSVPRIDPLKPRVFSLFRIIFMIPAVPSASYRAEGLVITSTDSIASAGSC
jgi:hypothetical protein